MHAGTRPVGARRRRDPRAVLHLIWGTVSASDGCGGRGLYPLPARKTWPTTTPVGPRGACRPRVAPTLPPDTCHKGAGRGGEYKTKFAGCKRYITLSLIRDQA